MREKFIDKRFAKSSSEIIDVAVGVLDEYRAQGYDLTLRQLYYQLVARNLFPEERRFQWTGKKWIRHPEGTKNADPNYKWLGSKISDGRLAGIVDWSMIVDRGRVLKQNPHWDDPADIVKQAANQFRIDVWEDQEYYIEVMVEKDALSGVLGPVCSDLDIAFMANKGYSSSSAMYRAGKRMAVADDEGRIPLVLYLGDHDPSGMDMDRDIEERLEMFAGRWVEVIRIALDMEQIEKYNPPPDPAKASDSRFRTYQIRYGNESWELDALEPATLEELVREAVADHTDEEAMKSSKERQQKMKTELKTMAKEYKKKQDGKK